MEFSGARGFSVGFLHSCENFAVCPGDENVVARVFLLQHGANDFCDLLRRFSFGKDHFSKTLAQVTMMIHFGEAEVLEGQVLQTIYGSFRRKLSGSHEFQNLQQFCLIH